MFKYLVPLLAATAVCYSGGDCPDQGDGECVCATLASLGLFGEDGEEYAMYEVGGGTEGDFVTPTFLVGQMIYPRARIGTNREGVCQSFMQQFCFEPCEDCSVCGWGPCQGCEGTVQITYPDGSLWPPDAPIEHGEWGLGCPDHPPALDFEAPVYEVCFPEDGSCRLVFSVYHTGILQNPNPCQRQAFVSVPAFVVDPDTNDDGVIDILDLISVACCDHDTRCDGICDAEDLIDVIMYWGQEVPIPNCED